MKNRKNRRKSQELREKVKLLFNDPISHRNPHSTEVYFSKRTQQIKTPKFLLLYSKSTHVYAHIYTYIKSLLNIYSYIFTHILTAMIRYYWSIWMPTGYNTYVLNKNITHTPLPRFMKCSALKLHFMELLSKVLDKIYGSKERTWVWLKEE